MKATVTATKQEQAAIKELGREAKVQYWIIITPDDKTQEKIIVRTGEENYEKITKAK